MERPPVVPPPDPMVPPPICMHPPCDVDIPDVTPGVDEIIYCRIYKYRVSEVTHKENIYLSKWGEHFRFSVVLNFNVIKSFTVYDTFRIHFLLQFNFMRNEFEEDTSFGDGVGFIVLEAEVRAVGDPVCRVPESDEDLVLWTYVSEK